jgi:hypothetical protein
MNFLQWLLIIEAIIFVLVPVGLVITLLTNDARYVLIPLVAASLVQIWHQRQLQRRQRQATTTALRRMRNDLSEEIQALRQSLPQESASPGDPDPPRRLLQLQASREPIWTMPSVNARLDRVEALIQSMIGSLEQVLPTPFEYPPGCSPKAANAHSTAQSETASQPTAQALPRPEFSETLWQEVLFWQQGLSFTAHEGWVNAFALSPDEQTLVTGGNDRQLRFWELKTGQPCGTCEASAPVSALAFNPEGQIVVSGCYDHRTQLWQAKQRDYIRTLEGHQGSVQAICVATNPETRTEYLISGSYDQTILLWSLQDSQPLQSLVGHQGKVQSLALGQRQTLLASGSDDGQVFLWRLPDGQKLSTFQQGTGAIEAIALSADEQYVAGGCSDGLIRLWHLTSQDLLYSLEAHTGPVTALVVAARDRLLISGGADGRIKFWDLRTGQLFGNLAEPVDAILNLALSASGQLLISSHPSGRVQLWWRKQQFTANAS